MLCFFHPFSVASRLVSIKYTWFDSKDLEAMSRRPVNPARRLVGNGGFPPVGAFPSKTRSSPLVSVTLVALVCHCLSSTALLYYTLYPLMFARFDPICERFSDQIGHTLRDRGSNLYFWTRSLVLEIPFLD